MPRLPLAAFGQGPAIAAAAALLAACGALPPAQVVLSFERPAGGERPEAAVLEVEYMQDYILQKGVHIAERPLHGEFLVFDPRGDLPALPLQSDPASATLLVPGRVPARLDRWPTLRRAAPPTQVGVPWPAAPARAEDARVRYARFGPRAGLPPDAAFGIRADAGGSWAPRAAPGWAPWPDADSRIPREPGPGPWRSFDVMLLRPVAGADRTSDLVTVFAARFDPATQEGEVFWIEQRVPMDRYGPEIGFFGFPAWPGWGYGRVVDARSPPR